MNESVRIEDDQRGFRRVLLNRPSSRNAIDGTVVEGIEAGIVEAPGSVVVLGSTDPTAFSSGVDLKLDNQGRAEVSRSLYRLYGEMRRDDKIIIAAASGPAIGGGAQLLVASDIRFASKDLTVRFAGAGHGLVVGAWGLPSLVGRGRASDLCLSMRAVGSEEALSIGLADRLVDDPLREASAYAAAVCELDPGSVVGIKRTISISFPDEALESERIHNSAWDGVILKDS